MKFRCCRRTDRRAGNAQPLDTRGGEASFSGGVRRWGPLETRYDLTEIARLDWSLTRPAFVRSQLVWLIDVPSWQQDNTESLFEQTLTTSLPRDAMDAIPAPSSLVGSAVDMDGGAYRPMSVGPAIRWEFSPDLCRLRGQVKVSHASPRTRQFARYLLHLNRDLRFVRVGYGGKGTALQAILPSDDRKWVHLAEHALKALYEVLNSQFAWWHQPRELVDDLYRQVDCGSE